MIQPLVNVWIGTLIGTSLAAAVGVYELTAEGQFLQLSYAGGLPLFGAIAVLYIAMALLSGRPGSWLERKVAIAAMSANRVLFDEPGTERTAAHPDRHCGFAGI